MTQKNNKGWFTQNCLWTFCLNIHINCKLVIFTGGRNDLMLIEWRCWASDNFSFYLNTFDLQTTYALCLLLHNDSFSSANLHTRHRNMLICSSLNFDSNPSQIHSISNSMSSGMLFIPKLLLWPEKVLHLLKWSSGTSQFCQILHVIILHTINKECRSFQRNRETCRRRVWKALATIEVLSLHYFYAGKMM